MRPVYHGGPDGGRPSESLDGLRKLVDLIRSLKTKRPKTMAQEIREKHPLPGTPKLQEEDFPQRIRREIHQSL